MAKNKIDWFAAGWAFAPFGFAGAIALSSWLFGPVATFVAFGILICVAMFVLGYFVLADSNERYRVPKAPVTKLRRVK